VNVEFLVLNSSRARSQRGDVEPSFRCACARALVVQILSLMNLPRRDRRDIWYSPGLKLSPLEWLQKTFTEINNGRHPEFSLPQRIEIVIPNSPLEEKSFDLRVTDTKGIDAAASRADLDGLFDDPRTIVVLVPQSQESLAPSGRHGLMMPLPDGAWNSFWPVILQTCRP
jgi:hypothetical protein